MLLKEVFGDRRIVGFAGEKSSGKTNNLMALVKDFRQHNKDTPIYVFGLEQSALDWILKFKNVYEINGLSQLSNKRDALFILDEMQLLKVNSRKHTEMLDKFVDFIYHHNNWVVLTSPSLREFNSIIGGKIQRWILKSMNISDLVNGSQLKDVAVNYNGRCKSLDSIEVDKDKILIINDEHEKVIELEYIKEVDSKLKNVNIFEIDKKLSGKKSGKLPGGGQ